MLPKSRLDLLASAWSVLSLFEAVPSEGEVFLCVMLALPESEVRLHVEVIVPSCLLEFALVVLECLLVLLLLGLCLK